MSHITGCLLGLRAPQQENSRSGSQDKQGPKAPAVGLSTAGSRAGTTSPEVCPGCCSHLRRPPSNSGRGSPSWSCPTGHCLTSFPLWAQGGAVPARPRATVTGSERLPLCSSSGGTPAVRRALGAWILGYLLAPGSLPAQDQPMLSFHCPGPVGPFPSTALGHPLWGAVTGTRAWSGISSTHSHDKHRCPQAWPGVPRAGPPW